MRLDGDNDIHRLVPFPFYDKNASNSNHTVNVITIILITGGLCRRRGECSCCQP